MPKKLLLKLEQSSELKLWPANKAKFSKQDILRAQKVRDLHHIAGHLSEKQLL